MILLMISMNHTKAGLDLVMVQGSLLEVKVKLS